MKRFFSVTVDGPSGAGKSTLARAAAARFGFVYVDTGAIYRTVALASRRSGAQGEAALTALLPTLRIGISYDARGLQHMALNGEDVTEAIRAPEISMLASEVSAVPAVRAFLLERQRALSREHNVVMDGRDIGTVVLPDADLKVFLTARPETRAARRCAELRARGMDADPDAVLAELRRRDEQDTHRAAAPLRKPAGAVCLDTSALSLEESIEALCRLIAEKLETWEGQ